MHDKLGACGAAALLDALALLKEGRLVPLRQDESLATYAPKIEKEDCVINFGRTAREIHNQIRGLSPFPLAFTHLPGGKMLKITSAEVADDATCASAKPGEVVMLDEGIVVACGSGCVRLTGVLPEGRGRMSAADFIRGRRVAVGDILE